MQIEYDFYAMLFPFFTPLNRDTEESEKASCNHRLKDINKSLRTTLRLMEQKVSYDFCSWSYQVNPSFSKSELFVIQKQTKYLIFLIEFYMPLNLLLNDACNPSTKSLFMHKRMEAKEVKWLPSPSSPSTFPLFFNLPILLRYNWNTSLCKFKTYSIMIWLTFIMKW